MARKPSKTVPTEATANKYTKAAMLMDPESCFNRAHDNEPVFLLRANDPLAPTVVRSWAERYRERKRGPVMDMVPRELAKYQEAYELARAMESWFIGRQIQVEQQAQAGTDDDFDGDDESVTD